MSDVPVKMIGKYAYAKWKSLNVKKIYKIYMYHSF